MIEEDLAKLNTMNINELKKLFLRYFNAHPTLKTKEAYITLYSDIYTEAQDRVLKIILKNLYKSQKLLAQNYFDIFQSTKLFFL